MRVAANNCIGIRIVSVYPFVFFYDEGVAASDWCLLSAPCIQYVAMDALLIGGQTESFTLVQSSKTLKEIASRGPFAFRN